MTESERQSFCRICAAACGIIVTVDGDQVLRVRGDSAHPVSRGYTCSKGRALPAWHHSSERLHRPRVRGEEVGWNELLDDLGGGISRTVADHGADSVALYLATGFAYDSAGQVAAAMWLRGLGSTSFYTAATVDNAPVLVAAELVAGNPMLNPVWEPDSHGLLLIVGCNPVVSHGYGTTLPDPVRYLRDHRSGGGRTWVLDPRRTETAALADHHLAVRPDADVEVLAALAAGLLASGAAPDEVRDHCDDGDIEALRSALAPYTLDRAAETAGVALDELGALLEELRTCDGRLAAFCGTGTTMARDGVLVDWLRWVLLILTGSLDRAGGMRFNRGAVNRLRPPSATPTSSLPGPRTRPDLGRVVGQVPAVALADEIEGGQVRALLVTGGNPLGALPEPERVRRALASLDVLAVLDVAQNELVAMATHVLPATGQLERSDLSLAEHVSLRSGIQATPPVVSPVGDRRSTWWMLAQLGQRCGVDLLAGVDPDDLTDQQYLSGLLARGPLDAADVFVAGPHGREVEREYGWVKETMLPNGKWRIAPPVLLDRLAARTSSTGSLVLIPRREMAWSNSVRYAGDGAEPELRLHPADAAASDVADAQVVTVSSGNGQISATLRVDPSVREGVASLTHGRVSARAGMLTSSTVDVDPLTGMPHTSGVPVTVIPAG